jgi:mannose-6-phosphate isomerase
MPDDPWALYDAIRDDRPAFEATATRVGVSSVDAPVSVVSPRLDAKPWGGRKLGEYGLDLPAGAAIGEALVTADEAVVTEGFRAGETLGDIVASDRERFLGSTAGSVVGDQLVFPLLVKLIDASENLSIQVHPNDSEAQGLGRLGKTEAWHVLAADPGALLYLGVRPGVDMPTFQEAAARLDGSSASLMRAIPAQAGTTVLIPAGTIHALGAGVMVYEVQQPSDVTYRLDDWGRVDALGNPREMHLEAGFQVSRPGLLPELIIPVSLRPAIGERHLLAACRYFSLERVALPTGARFDLATTTSPAVITMIRGEASIQGHALGVGTSAVVWPSPGNATLTASQPLVALVAYVPDLERDVVQPASRAGSHRNAITALAGATGDLLPGAAS